MMNLSIQIMITLEKSYMMYNKAIENKARELSSQKMKFMKTKKKNIKKKKEI